MSMMTAASASGQPWLRFRQQWKNWSGEVGFQDSDLTSTFCLVRVWNQFQAPGRNLEPFSKPVGCVMKEQFASPFAWTLTSRACFARSQALAAQPAGGPINLWRLSMAVLLGIVLLGFSEPVRSQAVNAALLGTVTDSSGAVISGATVT